jgi:aldose 1-epimerase
VNLCVPNKNGGFTDVMLGYDNLEGYITGKSSHGSVIGRYANRIAGGKITIGGKTYNLSKNNGDNCLHGGLVGYDKRVWSVHGIADGDSPSVSFAYVSPDGEENFPAELKVIVRYTLTACNALKIEYSAMSDGETIFNPTNHAYFNLGGQASGDILNTRLQIFAESYTPFNAAQIPTGEKAPVAGTVFDFTEPKLIGDDINSGKIDGYDHNFILGEPGIMRKAAAAYNAGTGITMTTYTDMPAMQLYIALHFDGSEKGKGGVGYDKFGGFCLETQFSPNTPNMPDFPQCALKKGGDFRYTTEYAFS